MTNRYGYYLSQIHTSVIPNANQLGLFNNRINFWYKHLGSIYFLSPMQSDETLLANNFQHCWMLHVASVCTPCCMLLYVVGSCCAKSETSQTYEPTPPNISFVSWSPKRSTTMLDPFAQLFLCATHAHYTWSSKSYGLYPSHDALQVPTLLVWFEWVIGSWFERRDSTKRAPGWY